MIAKEIDGQIDLEQQILEGGLTGDEECVRLDTQGSVSGLRRDETSMPFDEDLTDEQFERWLDSTELVP